MAKGVSTEKDMPLSMQAAVTTSKEYFTFGKSSYQAALLRFQ
jgi:hypothetical protein